MNLKKLEKANDGTTARRAFSNIFTSSIRLMKSAKRSFEVLIIFDALVNLVFIMKSTLKSLRDMMTHKISIL